MKVHHVGYLVKKLDKALKAFEQLGYEKISDITFDGYRGINICFIRKDGYVIELVSPVSKESVVGGLYKKLGNTPYHICYETDNINKAIMELEGSGYVLASELHEAKAFNNRKVCFYIHPYLGMVELLEKDE